MFGTSNVFLDISEASKHKINSDKHYILNIFENDSGVLTSALLGQYCGTSLDSSTQRDGFPGFLSQEMVK